MAAKYPRGGHSYDFMNRNLDKKFICSHCKKVYKDPQKTECCKQVFCKSCLEHLLTTNQNSCPQCRKRGQSFSYHLDKSLKDEIDTLRIKCTNQKDGCLWIGELRSIKTHLEYSSLTEECCQFIEVKCPNGCKKKISRKELENHLEKVCLLRSYTCEYCGYEDTYEVITGHRRYRAVQSENNHYSKCPEYPLQCPNKCSKRDTIKRKEMEDHRKQCPEQMVGCPNKCQPRSKASTSRQKKQFEMKRKQLDKHLATECKFRPHNCEYCGLKSTYSAITTEHYKECPNFKLKCQNCGKIGIKRKDMQNHQSKCLSTKYSVGIKHEGLFEQTNDKDLHQCDYCGMKDLHTAITSEHYNNCPDFPLKCPHMCGSDVKRKDLKDHCTKCLEATIECPNKCGQNVKRRETTDHFTRCLEVTIECPNKCGQNVKRKEIESHCTRCSEEMTECPNKCGQNFKRKDINGHRKQCLEELVQCPEKCGVKELKRKNMKNHSTVCPEEKVVCPNGCFSDSGIYGHPTTIKRKDITKHSEHDCILRSYECEHCGEKGVYHFITTEHPKTCSKRYAQIGYTKVHANSRDIVQCPYEEVGCTRKLVRRDLEQHKTEYQNAHLLMLMEAFKTMKKEMMDKQTTLQDQITTLTQRIEELEQGDKQMKPEETKKKPKRLFNLGKK